MDFLILRNFDHQGYYETRIVLFLLAISAAVWLWRARKENRYLLILVSSGLMMALTEYLLQWSGLRGSGYHFLLFDQRVPTSVGPLIQGLLEGGICGVMALWFADLRASGMDRRQWLPYLGLCGLIVGLSVLAGGISSYRPLTSVRPIFAPGPVVINTTIIFVSLLIAWRREALPFLANFYAGLLIFSLLNFEPLHLMHARYVGLLENGLPVAAPTIWQYPIMALSHLYDSSGGKLHYFAIPFALGLIRVREKSPEEAEKVPYQRLQTLSERGWRKKSKPFQR